MLKPKIGIVIVSISKTNLKDGSNLSANRHPFSHQIKLAGTVALCIDFSIQITLHEPKKIRYPNLNVGHH